MHSVLGLKSQDAIWPIKMNYLYLYMQSYKCWWDIVLAKDVQRCTAECACMYQKIHLKSQLAKEGFTKHQS